MTDHIDDWRKLKRFDTNIQSELHANLLKNNGIQVSQQGLNGIPGMNSGGVLWVLASDFEKAQQILDNIDTGSSISSEINNDINADIKDENNAITHSLNPDDSNGRI